MPINTEKRLARWDKLLESAKTRSRFGFIAEYLVYVTELKRNRDFTENKQVFKVRGKKYKICTIKDRKRICPWAPMTADNLFEEARRSRLDRFIREAEEIRDDVLTEEK
jgi:hypothetical protein